MRLPLDSRSFTFDPYIRVVFYYINRVLQRIVVEDPFEIRMDVVMILSSICNIEIDPSLFVFYYFVFEKKYHIYSYD